MEERSTTIISVLSAFVIGGLIGAGIALLMAPQSGEKTRGLIMSKGSDLRDKALGTAEDTRDRASKAINNISKQTKDRVSTMRDRTRDMVKR